MKMSLIAPATKKICGGLGGLDGWYISAEAVGTSPAGVVISLVDSLSLSLDPVFFFILFYFSRQEQKQQQPFSFVRSA
jgi:hypothetical protein